MTAPGVGPGSPRWRQGVGYAAGVAEPSTTVHDSFGANDHLHDPVAGEVSATNEAIKDRQALRRLVRAGILPADQMPPPPRRLTPFFSPADAPPELQAAVAAALAMPSLADNDED
jgi:hypothetical protein